MRKLALLAATLAAAVAATGAGAAAPEHYRVPIQDTFFAPFMSGACGVPVTITIEGTANVLLQRNDAGLIVREHDVLSSFTAVFESPTELGGTGRSFTNRSPGVATFDYGDGATIGSTAVITLTGLAGPAAGASSLVCCRASSRRQACALVRSAASGWFTSCAMAEAISPIALMRPTRASC